MDIPNSDAPPVAVEKMGPLRGDGNQLLFYNCQSTVFVEKMGPLRGDGNQKIVAFPFRTNSVEKMGPLRGDGNTFHKC